MAEPVKLDKLLQDIPRLKVNGLPSLEVAAITTDSRKVTPGALFVAIQGTNENGHIYLPEAEQAGASVALGQEPNPGLEIPYVQTEDSRLAYAHLAAAWHGFPARELVMIGITGTDGKTTTSALLYEILQRSGMAVGLISTVSARIGSETVDTGLHVTTPDPMDLQGFLRRMREARVTHCILEATSHGLAQHRVAACEFDLGVVTNVTHEHLDFHGSYEEYRRAKGLLVEGLSSSFVKPEAPEKTAILNMDDESFEYLRRIAEVRQIGYGFGSGADVKGTVLNSDARGMDISVESEAGSKTFSTPLIGAYNANNIVAAYAAATETLAVDPGVAAKSISDFKGVPGRMEAVDLGQQFQAIVDFAHTPNALKEALTAARALTDGRVIAVFGSAGLRDRAKRRMMAEISAEQADLSILTAEDPRTEPLEQILGEMADGARSRGGRESETFWIVPDRGEAIRTAVRMAEPGDLVIACGKGHEQSMCFGETEYPWDDRIAMRAALADYLKVSGPEMPVLPTSVET